jgi:hypothetical protein
MRQTVASLDMANPPGTMLSKRYALNPNRRRKNPFPTRLARPARRPLSPSRLREAACDRAENHINSDIVNEAGGAVPFARSARPRYASSATARST